MIEMLMVIGITGILLIVLFQVFGAILSTKLRSQATSFVAQDSRYLLARLAYDISRASDITSGTGSALSLVIDGSTYLYSLSGESLVLSVGGGDPQSLTGVGTKINSLIFTRTDLSGNKAISISLNIAPTIIQPGGVTHERQLTTTIGLR